MTIHWQACQKSRRTRDDLDHSLPRPSPLCLQAPIIKQNTIDVVNNVLSGYQPIHASDDTAKVLRAFIDHLSGLGLSTLQSEIFVLASDPCQLRQLRNFLVDAILEPMAAAGGKQPPVTPSPNQSAALAIELVMTRAGQMSASAEMGTDVLSRASSTRRPIKRCLQANVGAL
ncbi:hypothetical protein B0T25DRAFT_584134 [Lasiosphaeria hispida]|uniref:Uncharacterized protein n=1 Tax=Lasiosphaeria hispida TaxID=260671 RepID=A0AAJ0HCJ0_9PEZI|nr:hypothetical protein B0T25DRAFT_584134 [Lasiosphaeria hispida]